MEKKKISDKKTAKKEKNQKYKEEFLNNIKQIKEDFATNRNLYVNKVCRVNAMETTEDYKLRHGKFLGFRDDITIEDCTFEKIFGEK